MKKLVIICSVIVLSGVAVLGGWYLYNVNEANRQNNENKPPTFTNGPTPSPTPPPSATQTGTYKDYSQAAFSESASTTRILFFHSPWCPQCRALDADIKTASLPDNTTILKVDYDSNQDLRKKYGVTLQTTLVKVDASGNLVRKYVAYNEPNYAAVKAALLD